MAENESLDLGTSHAKRWDAVFNAVQYGESCEKITPKVCKALYGGLRRALKQFQEQGISLSDLLGAQGSRHRLRQLVRQLEGHQYAQLLEAAAHASGPAAEDCLRGWVDWILDKVFDQIKLRVAETDDSRTFYELKELANEVREALAAEVERIADNLAKNPHWRPQLKPGKAKGEQAVSPTEELLSMSLLGDKQP
jgi:hypothetical protein